MKKVVITFITVIFLLIIILFLTARETVPEIAEIIPPAGFESGGSAQIRVDSDGVVHINAPTDQELMFAWGYMHAHDRLWQMDYFHRVGLGISAEAYGFHQITTDFLIRALRIPEKARELKAELAGTPEGELISYYALGVNHYLKENGSYSHYKFVESGLTPLKWSEEATIMTALMLSLEMTKRGLFEGVAAEKNRQLLGAERYDQLFAVQPELQEKYESFTIEKSAENTGETTYLMNSDGKGISTYLPAAMGIPGGGTNSLVLAPQFNEDGNTLLANDAHLALQNPSFWHEVHLTTDSGEVDAIGFSVPGLPFMEAGRNPSVAWGVSLAYSTALELTAFEKGEAENSIILGNEEVILEKLRPGAKIRVGPFYLPVFWETFMATPDVVDPKMVAYDAGFPLEDDRIHMVRWAGIDIQSLGVSAGLDLLKSLDVYDVDEAFKKFELPNFNMVFADTSGNIGYRQIGLVAKRQYGRAGLIDYADEKQRWQGYLTPDEMPAGINPDTGYFISCNNSPVIDHYFRGNHLGEYQHPGYRVRRIENIIKEKGIMTVEDLAALQMDTQVPDAEILLPGMLSLLEIPAEAGPVIKMAEDLLKKWNLRADKEEPAPTLFRLWKDELSRALFATENVAPNNYGLWRVLHKKVGITENEKLEELVYGSFINTLEKLKEDLGDPGPDFQNWAWGNYHLLTISDVTGNENWNIKTFGADGDEQTLNYGRHVGEGPYEMASGASFRFVVELSDPVESFAILPSNNRDLPEFEDIAGINDWREGKLRKHNFGDSEIEENTIERIVLKW